MAGIGCELKPGQKLALNGAELEIKAVGRIYASFFTWNIYALEDGQMVAETDGAYFSVEPVPGAEAQSGDKLGPFSGLAAWPAIVEGKFAAGGEELELARRDNCMLEIETGEDSWYTRGRVVELRSASGTRLVFFDAPEAQLAFIAKPLPEGAAAAPGAE